MREATLHRCSVCGAKKPRYKVEKDGSKTKQLLKSKAHDRYKCVEECKPAEKEEKK